MLSVGLVSLREHLDERISAHDVTVGGYATLGFVNTNVVIGKLPASHRTAVAEPYRLLSYNLIYSSEDRPVHSLLVASSTRREGRTTVAVNLATVLASEGKKVAIVDANLRRPALHKMFGIDASGGLTEYLAGTLTADGLLVPTATQNLFVVPTGPVADVSSKLLDSPAMRELIARLREQVDYVIVDAPATTAGPDAQILSTMVDGVVYVARLDVTKKSSLRYGLDLLAKAHANVLGVVIGDPTQTAAKDVYAED
jgi:capsular exopolysaccharide synthesis family protein